MTGRRTMRERLRRPHSARELLWVRVALLALFTVAVVLGVASAFLLLERDAPGTEVTNYGDALFWTASQMSTVSSSLPNPITDGGRILAVSVDFTSVAVVSLLFGSIAQHIHITSPRKERHFRRPGGERDRPAG
jgi:hypothetical protein